MTHYDKGSWSIANAPPRNHGKIWSKDDEERIVNLAKSRTPLAKIAEVVGRKEDAIIERLDRLEVLKLYYREEWERRHWEGDPYATVVRPRTLPDHRDYLKDNKMLKITHLITLLQKGYTTVNVRYEAEGRPAKGTYTYKVSDEIAKTLEEGGRVVVPAGTDFKVAWVDVVHPEPELDPSVPYELKWVVCKVDFTQYDEQTKREAQAYEMIKKGERKAAQRQAMETLLASVDNRDELIKLLSGGN